MVLGNMDIDMQEKEVRPLSITLHENYAQMDQRPKRETLNHHCEEAWAVSSVTQG